MLLSLGLAQPLWDEWVGRIKSVRPMTIDKEAIWKRLVNRWRWRLWKKRSVFDCITLFGWSDRLGNCAGPTDGCNVDQAWRGWWRPSTRSLSGDGKGSSWLEWVMHVGHRSRSQRSWSKTSRGGENLSVGLRKHCRPRKAYYSQDWRCVGGTSHA